MLSPKNNKSAITLKDYLVVSESDLIGYIIDSFYDMKEADNLVDFLGSKQQINWKSKKHNDSYEKQVGYKSYRVHLQQKYAIGNYIRQATNGSYSVMIFSTCEKPNFSENLIFERGHTVYAIDIAAVKDENKFINDYHPDLLAN
jgi:hypothetical protein